MNPADEPHRPRSQRRLIVAEKRAGPRQFDRNVVRIFHHRKISQRQRSDWRSRLVKHAEHFALPVHHRNHQRVGRNRSRRRCRNIGHFGRRQRLKRNRWRWRWRPRSTSASASRQHTCKSKHQQDPGARHFLSPRQQRRGRNRLPESVNSGHIERYRCW